MATLPKTLPAIFPWFLNCINLYCHFASICTAAIHPTNLVCLHFISLVTSCVGLQEEEPQTADPHILYMGVSYSRQHSNGTINSIQSIIFHSITAVDEHIMIKLHDHDLCDKSTTKQGVTPWLTYRRNMTLTMEVGKWLLIFFTSLTKKPIGGHPKIDRLLSCCYTVLCARFKVSVPNSVVINIQKRCGGLCGLSDIEIQDDHLKSDRLR